jgi:hypothetical protein
VPCIPIPKLPIPTLPDGITLALPLPSIHVTIPGFCCLLPGGIPIDIAPVLPPLTLTSALLLDLEAGLAAVEAWIASLPLDCPRQ